MKSEISKAHMYSFVC